MLIVWYDTYMLMFGMMILLKLLLNKYLQFI